MARATEQQVLEQFGICLERNFPIETKFLFLSLFPVIWSEIPPNLSIRVGGMDGKPKVVYFTDGSFQMTFLERGEIAFHIRNMNDTYETLTVSMDTDPEKVRQFIHRKFKQLRGAA